MTIIEANYKTEEKDWIQQEASTKSRVNRQKYMITPASIKPSKKKYKLKPKEWTRGSRNSNKYSTRKGKKSTNKTRISSNCSNEVSITGDKIHV